jgi:hypothetical protein
MDSQDVKKYLESSQAVSLLHEYCQKHQHALPVWDSGKKQLTVLGQRFTCVSLSQKDAKRRCAVAAVNYFQKLDIPFFLEHGGYVQLIHQLSQLCKEPVKFEFHGAQGQFVCHGQFGAVKFEVI